MTLSVFWEAFTSFVPKYLRLKLDMITPLMTPFPLTDTHPRSHGQSCSFGGIDNRRFLITEQNPFNCDPPLYNCMFMFFEPITGLLTVLVSGVLSTWDKYLLLFKHESATKLGSSSPTNKMSQQTNEDAICKTAPATPGLPYMTQRTIFK